MEDMLFLEQLNPQQKKVCIEGNNILLKACPGSGKTRTLTYKLAYIIKKYELSKKINIAITYTNRAADEIRERLEKMDIPEDKVWVGTIHQFCLEFIIRPYTMYHNRLKKGYHIIDEYVQSQYVDEIVKNLGIDMGYNKPFDFPEIVNKYEEKLLAEKEIDFNDILKISFELVKTCPFIAENIGGVTRSILVDEYQDANELQYGILGCIVSANKKILLTFVGDTDQAIYGALGGIAKTSKELELEFGVAFKEEKLDGCYRTTQRIIDYYSNFQLKYDPIYAVSEIKNEMGCLVYNNTINKTDLFEGIAQIVKRQISEGIPENEICIIAPQWWLLFPLSKQMKTLLPNVKFDAPDITPIKYDPMNVFFLFARLLFTEPGKKTWIRKKIANEIVKILSEEYKIELHEKVDTYMILKVVNSLLCEKENGLDYLQRSIIKFFHIFGVNLSQEQLLQRSYESFIAKINDRVQRYDLSTCIDTFKQCFKEKEGVVINTFHGVKGEEYDTVIAFGILNGYIPHWDTIIRQSKQYREDETKKLLYVVCSRAKKNLYLFSEQGRTTTKGELLTSTDEMHAIEFEFDEFQ
ncbi:ATP-dependent helicase [Erysipelotrichaceae bacterium OH741_COT-311]|nr:ATP-dependent helicase [Erysipelotrichaceae bacterium OH741_COT-311]